MDSTNPTPPRIERSNARRERSPYWRSLARFLGLGALGALLGRTVFKTRTRRILAGVTAAAVLTGAAVLILGSTTENVVYQQGTGGAVLHSPGASQAPGVVSSASNSVDLTKSYPRIYSTKLGIDIAIQPGNGQTPPVQPIAFQYPHSAALGQPGNTYLYAHDRPGMFLGLHQARIGDVVIVAMSPTQKLYFQVTEIHPNVAWNDLAWLRPSHDSRLTLQTCNYSGDFDPRFIVITQPIPADQGAALTGGA